MKYRQAAKLIAVILEAVDDDELPKPKLEENGDGTTIAWFGGYGRNLGSAKDGWGERKPEVHRTHGILDAMQGEAVYRLDRKLLKKERKAARDAAAERRVQAAEAEAEAADA
jgi:hypothetical protein